MINYYNELKLDASLSCEQLAEDLRGEQRKWIGRTNAPDLNRRQEAERKVAIIEEAQKVLTDEVKRKEYDEKLSDMGDQDYKQGEESQADYDFNAYESDASNLIDQAWEFVIENKYADAIMVARRATEIEPKNPEAWSILARAYHYWGDIDDAISSYKQAINVKMNESAYYTDLGNLYLDLDRVNEAEEYSNKALSINPDDNYNKLLAGNIAVVRNEYNKAIVIFKELLKEQPNNESYKQIIANSYYAKGISFCSRAKNGYIYCVNGGATHNMIKCMYEAKQYFNDIEYDNKIAWGEKALKKKFYKKRWKLFIIPAIFVISSRGIARLQMILITSILVYLNMIPEWKLTRSALFNEEITYGSQIKDGFKDALNIMTNKSRA